MTYETQPRAEVGSGHEITLQGWDTANAVTLDVLNEAIVARESTPPRFASDAPGPSIEGEWAPWQVVPGGSGRLLEMECPIASGKADKGDGSPPIDLAGAKLKIQVTLDKLPGDAFEDPTAEKVGGEDAKAVALVPRVEGTDDDPAVVIVSISPRSLRNPFQFVFEDWFNDHLKEFVHVFCAVMINERAAKEAFQWLKPTDVSYAVADTSTPGISAFAVLCQTDGDPDDELAHQIDPRIVQDLPEGTNSTFAISGEKLAQHILLPGAQQVMKGSKLEDFDVVGDGLVVTNNKDLTWRDLKLEDGNVVSPLVPKNQFRLRVVEDELELEFTGLTFDAPGWWMPGKEIVTISFTQYMHLRLQKREDGSAVLFPVNHDPDDEDFDPKRDAPDLRKLIVNVTLDESARDFQEFLSWVAIVTSILPLGVGLFKAGRWVLRTGTTMANRAAEAFNAARGAATIAMDAAEIAAMTDRELAGTNNLAAAAAMAKAAEIPAASISTVVNRFAFGFGMVSAITGGLWALGDLQHIADEKIDDVPGLDTFMANVLGASRWFPVQDWSLEDVRLAESLLLYGKLTTGV